MAKMYLLDVQKVEYESMGMAYYLEKRLISKDVQSLVDWITSNAKKLVADFYNYDVEIEFEAEYEDESADIKFYGEFSGSIGYFDDDGNLQPMGEEFCFSIHEVDVI